MVVTDTHTNTNTVFITRKEVNLIIRQEGLVSNRRSEPKAFIFFFWRINPYGF